jgi:endonuclease/exonuclease/phosphatase (EEP) superfamily protein YafD
MKFLRHSITALAVGLATCITSATLIGASMPNWWLGDLLSHPQPQYALGLLVCGLWLIPKLGWRAGVIGIPLLFNLSNIAPLYAANPAMPAPAARPIRILHYNLDMTAPDHQDAFAYLRQHPADILFLQELTPDLANQIPVELPGYHVAYARPLPNTHGSALLLPIGSDISILAAGDVHLPESSPRPLITATLALDGHPFTLLSIQVIRPKDAYTEDIQEHEYAAAAAWIRDQRTRTGYPIIVIGDCNTTPWSDRFRRFLAQSGLRDSSIGFGLQPTWPAFAPGLLGIPIDHALMSPDIAVTAREAGQDLGGDHRPLLVTVMLAAAR